MNDGYAKNLQEIIAGVDREIEAVAEHGFERVNINGLVCEEILAGIANAGQITWRRLVKDHVAFLNNSSSETADAYLTALHRAGLVSLDKSTRGIHVVSLSPRGLLFVKKGI